MRRNLAVRRPWLWFVCAVLVALPIYFALGDAVPRAALYDAITFGAGVATLVGVAIYKPARSAPWVILAIGELSYAAGDVLWDVMSLGLGQQPFPSVADAAYLAAYPMIAAGIWLLVARRLPTPRWQWSIDFTIVTGGMALLLWLVAVEPVLLDSTATPFEKAISLAYPIGDIVLLAALASIIVTPRVATVADAFLAGSIGAMLVGDVAFAAFPDLQAAGGPLDAVFLVSAALRGAAALHPSMAGAAEHGRADSEFSVRRIVALGLAAMAPSITLAIQLALGWTANLAPAAIVCIALSLLVLIDATLLMREKEMSIKRRQALESELFEARKLESLGRLAGGIAHDFNNILTAIIGFSDMAIASAPRADVESLVTIRESAQRAANLTRQLLAFGRRLVLQPQVVELDPALAETEPVLRQLLGDGIRLTVEPPADRLAIKVDRTQLDQVLLNLALNARDAMPDGGKLRIGVERRDVTEQSRPLRTMPPGEYAVISVEDSGCGIDAEALPHIFEPFFTTKDVGKGTGLGLATTQGIVLQSGGYVDVHSSPGSGTTFELFFPVVEPDALAVPRMVPLRQSEKHALTIMVVEDEPLIRELAVRILRGEGYEVVPVSGPIAAVERACRREQIDLLLTDIIMPAMSGLELARRLRSMYRADLPVVLMSGYAETIGEYASEANAFLPKPFTAAALIGAVAAALGTEVFANA